MKSPSDIPLDPLEGHFNTNVLTSNNSVIPSSFVTQNQTMRFMGNL